MSAVTFNLPDPEVSHSSAPTTVPRMSDSTIANLFEPQPVTKLPDLLTVGYETDFGGAQPLDTKVQNFAA
jgi:hypothetical protein